MENNTLLVAALKYLQMGWPVFPARKDDLMGKDAAGNPIIEINSKSPYVAWKQYQTTLPTEADVRSWWTQWPDALIGVATGAQVGFIVVDTEAGADLSLFGLDTIETPQASTGGGGVHYYFLSEPLVNAIRFAPLHDIRADGGYIVLPPSGHKSGGTYKWIVPFGTVALAPLPDAIRQALKSGVMQTGKSDIDRLIREGAKEGSRNASATQIAGSLLKHYPMTRWETFAWPVLENWNIQKCVPPLTKQELRASFDSIASIETQRRKTTERGVTVFAEDEMKPSVSLDGDAILVTLPIQDGIARFIFSGIEQTKSDTLDAMLTIDTLIPGSAPRPFIQRINLYSGSSMEALARQLGKAFGKTIQWDLLLNTAKTALIQFLANRDLSVDLNDVDDSEAAMLFDPFLVKNGANLLFGDGGTGKTFFCLRLAASLAIGLPFMGFRPKETCATLFVDYEDSEQTASYRLSRLGRSPNLAVEPKDLKDRIRYFNPQGMPLHTIIPALKKIIHERQIGLVLVDSVASACGAEPEKAEAASRYYNALKSLNVTSLSIAHVVKSENTTQDKAFGSVFWHNLARNTWNIQGADEESSPKPIEEAEETARQLGLFHRKFNNGARSRPLSMRIVYAPTHVRFDVGNPDQWNKDKRLEERVMSILRSKGGRTKVELSDDLINVPDQTLKNVLAIMSGKGTITKEDHKGGKYTPRDYVSGTLPGSPESSPEVF